MANNKLSFYRDFHRVAFFLVAIFTAFALYKTGLAAIYDRDAFVTGLVILAVCAIVLNFLGRRIWPERHAAMMVELKAWWIQAKTDEIQLDLKLKGLRDDSLARRKAKRAP